MSLQKAEALVRQYNKDLYQNKATAISDDKKSNRISGTWSYMNMYDALYDKYSQNKNFNINMWRDAIKLGEQDNYFTLLEQNKDNTLSSQFYDDEYYDYESMMMELYLPLADNTKLEKYTQDVFNNATGKWETQDLGEMTQRQYFQYLLDNDRAIKAQEIQRQIEQDKKDAMDFWETIGSDALATLGELGEGILTSLTGLIDVVGGLGYATYKGIEAGDGWTDFFIEYFGEVGLTQYEKETVRAALDEYERTKTHFRDIDGNITGVGKYFVGIANSIGMMVPSILLAVPTGGTSLAWLPQVTFYTSMFGNSMYETATNADLTGPAWVKITNTALKTGAEAIIEWGLGKVLGPTIQNKMLNIGGRNIDDAFIKGFTKTSGLKYLGKSAAQEGLEEFLQDFGTSCIDAFTDLVGEGFGISGYNKDGINFQTLVDSFTIGALSSIVLSGARVTAAATKSKILNHKQPGSGDIVIEVDGKTKKVTGLNRLYYGQILSDFKSAIDELKKGKFGTKKNFALAQEVYGAISTISQFYSSFDKKRIENCERLLSRVVEAEKTRADIIYTKEVTIDFAQNVENVFNDMVSSARIKHVKTQTIEKAKEIAKKATNKLEKGGVKSIKSAIDAELLTKGEERERLEKALGKIAVSRLDELSKDYEHIFTADGHVAIEEDKFLFVSEAWLKNYTVKEIREFLAQSEILDVILESKEFSGMVDTLEKFYKDFTKDTSIDREKIVEQFLFNKSVYQAFILSDGGKNIHAYKEQIFSLYKFIAGYGDAWVNETKNATPQRIALLKAICDKIKQTWQEPTLKAVLNWGFNLQETGADAILSPKALEFINLRKNRERVLREAGKGGKRSSAYIHTAEDIMQQGVFNDEELTLIRKFLANEATEKEALDARILLDFGDLYTTTFSPERSSFISGHIPIINVFVNLLRSGGSIEEWKNLALEAARHLSDFTSDRLSKTADEAKRIYVEKVFALSTNDNATIEDYEELMYNYAEISDNISENLRAKPADETTIPALTLPYQVASLLETGDIAGTQFVADVLNEFQQIYGISARQMMMGDLTGMSIQQRNQLTRDMEAFGTTNFVRFVQRRLENMLGDNYIVTPTAAQRKPFRPITDGSTVAAHQKKIKNWLERSASAIAHHPDKRYTNETFFFESSGDITPENYRRVTGKNPPDVLIEFWNEYKRIRETDKHGALVFLIYNKDLINTFYEDILVAADPDYYEFLQNDTGVYDFVVAKKVSADKLLNIDILSMSLEERTDLFFDMADGLTFNEKVTRFYIHMIHSYQEFFNSIDGTDGIDDIDREHYKALEKELSEYVTRIEAGEILEEDTINPDMAEMINKGIDPYTGEVIFESSNTSTVPDFVDISVFEPEMQERLRKTIVVVEDMDPRLGGYCQGNKIAINSTNENPFDTFVHEFNHRLQNIYFMPNGFNTERAYNMPDFLAYIVNNHRIVVDYYLRKCGYDLSKYSISNFAEADIINVISHNERDCLATIAYFMVQGEVWARTQTHNGKPIHGFLEIFTNDGGFILAPDNKTKFKVPSGTSSGTSSSEVHSPKITPALAGSALDVAIQRLFKLKWQQDREGSATTSRNTYHAHLTKASSGTLTGKLLGPGVSFMYRAFAKLSDVIRDPQTYLAPEILAKCNGDFSEDNVFWRVKEYVEANFEEGVSIDRNERQEYIWVDDNAFDDLLNTSTRTKAKSDKISIINKYQTLTPIKLTDFYSEEQLDLLGIDPRAYVIIDPDNGGSETVLDGEHPYGIIILDLDKNTTDAEFIDELNHEFRHLMQYYNGFAAGFTANFKVTDEMRADVKKHLPELFKNEDIVKWAKRVFNNNKTDDVTTYEDIIVQRYVYYMTSGELMAHAFPADQLYGKPVFVNTEAGNPTIYMSWYNPETGEGRYTTEYIGYGHTKDDTSTSTGSILPRVERKRKYTDRKVFIGEDGEVEKIIYEYEKKPRRFNKAKAEGTNLMHYWKKGEAYRQMDPEMQEFIIDTTGHEDELPVELIKGIEQAVLTKEVLFGWIRETDNMNQFTFDLIKKHFFPNTNFKSFQELNNFFVVDLQIWWAAVNVLKTKVDFKYILKENSVATLVDLLKRLESANDPLYKQIVKHSLNYYKNSIPSEKLTKYQRLFALQYFDGSLNSIFYVANSFLTTIKAYEEELVSKTTSTDATLRPSDTKDNKATTFGETISNSAKTAGSTGDIRNTGNDLVATFGVADMIDKDVEEMRVELLDAYLKKEGIDNMKDTRAREYAKTLVLSDNDTVARMYAELVNASLVGQEVKDETLDVSVQKEKTDTLRKNSRVNIRDRIRRRANKLLKWITEGKITFSQLPEEVQAMFTLEEAKTKDGKTIKNYVLKPEVYHVGRGRAKASVSTAKQYDRRFTYQSEVNITEDHKIFQHDVGKLLEAERVLDNTVDAIKKLLKVTEQQAAKGKEDIRRVEKRIAETATILEKALTRKPEKNENSGKVKEFRPKKKYTQTDTPNIFTVVSPTDMPDVLYKILDTSFDEFADTEVQFVSEDTEGNLYTKEKKGKFNSLTKHEVTNWDAFYEANRETLQTLTRNDVLEIIAYFTNASISNGPTGKFAAFEIFLLGFFVDAARHNYNNWNFSSQEIANLEKLYEQKASAAGSALNAVQQMLKVVNPMKTIKSRMLNDWDTITQDDKDDLIDLVDRMRTAKTVDEQISYAKAIDELFEQFNRRQQHAEELHAPRWSKAWWSKLWSKIKSWRYMAMLSGPATWIRNKLGNVVLLGINRSADTIGNFIFRIGGKGYRKEQWDLSSTAISQEAKAFIDTYILQNPVFDPMYNLSGKYDPRRKKEIEGERGLFVSVITKAYEKYYGAKANNFITEIIQWGISDGKFIKGATKRYFGKMLTIEAEKGNIDLSKGLSAKALDLFAEAVIMSNAEYMHKRSALSDMLDSVRDKHPALYESISFFEPFLNAGINWYVEKFIRLTPIGLIDACIRMARFEKQVEKLQKRRADGETAIDSRATEFLIRRDIGKGIVGTIFSVVGIILALAGRIRIDEEDEEFYVYAGDVKVDISNIFGSSSLFVGASIAQHWIEQKDGDVASIEDVLKILTDTMADGFIAADFLERHKWDNGMFEALLTETNSVLSSFVPQIWQVIIACTNNKKIRYSSGMKGIWERWLNTFVPTQPFGNRRVNPYTGELEDKYALPIVGGILQRGVLTGAKIWWVDISETERMCREYGINRNELSGEITVDGQKKKLDRLTLNKKYGELNKESLAKIKSQRHKVKMPNGKYQTLSWDKLSDEQRANVIERTMDRNADIAKIYIWTQEGHKYYASGSLWQELRDLGITKNVYKGDKGFVE